MNFPPFFRVLPVCLLLFPSLRQTSAYTLEGLLWPKGAKVVMQLELGPTSILLQDGSASWDASAADAVAIWNGYLDFISFSSVSGSAATKTSGDGKNSVFFLSTIFGESFGQDTLAVTVLLTPDGQGQTTSEADVVVNTAYRFDSYRGPLQTASADLHRIFCMSLGMS